MRLTGVWQRLVAAAVVSLAVSAFAGPAAADPSNPTDAQIAQSKQAVHDRAAEVGRITAELVQADAEMQAAVTRAEIAAERYNKARVDEQVAAHDAAAATAKAAQAQADVSKMLDRMDALAADNYRTGGTLGPLSALVTADKPADVLHDAGVLKVVGQGQADTLKALDLARSRQANALSMARAALLRQMAARQTAEIAKKAAELARADSQAAVQRVTARKSALQHQLAQAQARAGLLIAARQAAIARAVAAAKARAQAIRAAAEARAVAAAAARSNDNARSSSGTPGSLAGGFSGPPPRAHGRIPAIAVNAALSQLGKPYVWGAAGPDAYDCSGLMLWSYAHAGIYLPHFSGYQYDAGPHVPIGALAPGDLVFYSSNGAPTGIHHVAMYIGSGSIVEAPTEGIPVRVHVMYYDGLLPLGTRPY